MCNPRFNFHVIHEDIYPVVYNNIDSEEDSEEEDSIPDLESREASEDEQDMEGDNFFNPPYINIWRQERAALLARIFHLLEINQMNTNQTVNNRN